MKLALAILLAFCLSAEAQTSLYIVATVHQRTRQFNADSIATILARLKPDLILVEFDSSLFDKNFKFKKKLYTTETVGIESYISKHPTPIRPFDMKGRDRALKVSAAESAALERLRTASKLDPDQSQTYEEFIRTNKELVALLKKSPHVINQKHVYDLVERNRALLYKGLLDIIESRKELEDVSVNFRQSGIFWDWRNKRMVENILLYLRLEDFRDKKIVLFTGFVHKFYLLKELLSKQGQYGFVVKEYYQ